MRAMGVAAVLCLLAAAALAGEPMMYRADGRRPIDELYAAQRVLVERYGWSLREMFSERLSEKQVLPANCLATPRKGPALWIITGIHGEEPAGPNALVDNVERLGDLGRRVPMVVMPLCNPLGYARNWRYPNTARYSEEKPGLSVGDSDHLLMDAAGRPRAARASSAQCDALTRTVLEMARDYPPLLVLDFHEDDILEQGYIYSQGALGRRDPVGARIVAELTARGFPICQSGTTRFHEEIRGGMIADVRDGSVDELVSSSVIVVGGQRRPGPGAKTALVIETGSKGTVLSKRVKGHAVVFEMLDELWGLVSR